MSIGEPHRAFQNLSNIRDNAQVRQSPYAVGKRFFKKSCNPRHFRILGLYLLLCCAIIKVLRFGNYTAMIASSG
jgi:hypothetical protein